MRTNGRRRAAALLALAAASVCLACPTADTASSLPRGRVTIQGQTVEVEVAHTPADRQQGLSGRASLAPGKGLLFLHPQKGTHRYWMKDMGFAIDLVWIDGDRVVGVTHRAPPAPADADEASLPLYQGPGTYDTVLEVPAGYARAHGFAAGQRVAIDFDGPPAS